MRPSNLLIEILKIFAFSAHILAYMPKVPADNSVDPFAQAVRVAWDKAGISKQKQARFNELLSERWKQHQGNIPEKEIEQEINSIFHQTVFENPDEVKNIIVPIIIANLARMAFNPLAVDTIRLRASEALLDYIKNDAAPGLPTNINQQNILEISEAMLVKIIKGRTQSKN